VILPELREQDRLVEFVVTTRVTVPVKPFTGETVIVDVPGELVLTVRLVGFDVTLKFGELNGPSRANSIAVGAEVPLEYTMSIP